MLDVVQSFQSSNLPANETSEAAEDSSDEFEPLYGGIIESVFGEHTLSKSRVYDLFIQEFGPLVVHLISRYNKVTANSRTSEIVQEIYLQLKQAKSIERFLEQAHTSVPETITAVQAHRALGVTERQFMNALNAFHKNYSEGCQSKRAEWMPTPVEGTVFSKTAVYKTEDIMRLDTSGYFDDKSGEKDHIGMIPKATRKHFQNYIARSVHNRFKNYCRTEDRHNKERVWDTFFEFQGPTDSESAATSWESRLTSTDYGAAATSGSSNLASQEARTELGLLARKLSKTPAAPFKDRLFDLMVDGYDLDEAIEKLDLSSEGKRSTRRALDAWISVILNKKKAAKPARRATEESIHP